MEETRQKILGVDFDDTLFLHSFPHNYSEPNWPVINYVKEKKDDGWYIILVTCRTAPGFVNGAVEAARGVGIEFDAINANHPDMVTEWGDCRKIFCDEYIDDKCVNPDDIDPDTEHRPVIYIAGKMRGLPDNGKTHFDLAEAMLRMEGFTVLNPSDLPTGMPAEKYMPICLAMLDAADFIYMLNNWKDSEGARIEYHYAVCQNKNIIFEED